MRLILLVALHLQLLVVNGQLTCPPTGLICVTPTAYQFCINIDGKILLVGSRTSCPPDQTCDSTTAFPCVPSETTTAPPTTLPPTTAPPTTVSPTTAPPTTVPPTTAPPTTVPPTTAPPTTIPPTTAPPTTPVPVTAPTCNQTANFPGPRCDQYYHCLQVMWWWDYEVLTCPSGQAFDQTSGQCANSTTCVTN
ncbi:hypothetical protein TcasGA2_TC031356 [Tribolium castaneum]|uniref:Chitin-binding type-2 domain-containing protein n=1 Tax=Tribolium castaneum TaxID=7070 RepID=A0A139WB02_TRICA|nr:hypothetical protein TcasGA2_TC031356 [Tribolium castaneum]